ncbi:hypothetical protein J416_09299 [Gracilibacillus halophilus YIM-C55.5]|uniref:IrrE N-terminal-like domain-containing protein n=1 Tax=Gracilibacillus halophilus YIM-C55.5 TaxID=1308866 RepID=N4WKJ7_9BACI|nr:ImmA/IrrE family metallo-endopeptidase [Gracilibacillus halophilus]ENH96682.1 hypothetical protein J416_09299 [Gracilibacillus halophilus YIM-C55.5]
MNRQEALEEAINTANLVIEKYQYNIRYPLAYCCEPFILSILSSEEICIDSYPFKNKEMCGMLCIDEYEKTIVYNTNHTTSRRNFTLAHELGHYFLHSNHQVKFADRSKNLSNETATIIEMQANAFAAQIIIPKKILFYMIKNKFTFFKISKITRVSYEALFWIIVNHLTNELSISTNDAILVVDEYRDYSIGSHKNLVHHNFARIFKLRNDNSEKIVSDLKNGNKIFDFIRNINGEIIDVKQVSKNPFAYNY